MRGARVVVVAVAVVVTVAAIGCLFPIPRPSKACQEQIDACLKQCPPQQPLLDQGVGPQDTRTPCEKSCQDRCR